MHNNVSTFVYVNARGEVKTHSVHSVSESETYFQGICFLDKKLKTYRKDRIVEFFSSYEESESYINNNTPDFIISQIIIKCEKECENKSKFEICFTGFSKGDKQRLTDIAVESGMLIRASVTKDLDMLCCGSNAGPAKLEAARRQSVIVVSESQFMTFLDTGEIPVDS